MRTGQKGSVSTIARLNPTTDKYEGYDCATAAGFFSLVPQEGYEVKMNPTVLYPIVGSHDPTYAVTLAKSGDPVPPCWLSTTPVSWHTAQNRSISGA